MIKQPKQTKDERIEGLTQELEAYRAGSEKWKWRFDELREAVFKVYHDIYSYYPEDTGPLTVRKKFKSANTGIGTIYKVTMDVWSSYPPKKCKCCC